MKYLYIDTIIKLTKVAIVAIPTMKKILEGFDKDLEIVTVDHERMPKVIC